MIQRRTVSSLTPSSSAAWRIRRFDTPRWYPIATPGSAASEAVTRRDRRSTRYRPAARHARHAVTNT
ncbi:hypothetical protein I549_2812 [Mycobacterium avium subsp. avium 2285 (R)]|nr:hypothetical protein I549_2812 [Mycobacterium avium subsp. avium 2285 (R)]